MRRNQGALHQHAEVGRRGTVSVDIVSDGYERIRVPREVKAELPNPELRRSLVELRIFAHKIHQPVEDCVCVFSELLLVKQRHEAQIHLRGRDVGHLAVVQLGDVDSGGVNHKAQKGKKYVESVSKCGYHR